MTITVNIHAAKTQLSQAGTQQSTAINQVASSTAASLDQIVAQSSQSLAANQSAVAQTRQAVVDGFTQAATQTVQHHDESDNTAVNGLRTDTDTALSNVRTRLGQYSTDLTNDFTTTLAGMDAKITSEAEAAAAKVQPAWKTFVSILVKIIVAIVVAVAIAALFASGAGIVALLVGGALIGAAGAAVTYLTDCALGLQEFSARALVAEMVTGAIGGAIGAVTAGMGGAIGGMVAKGITNAVAQTVVNVAVSTGVSFIMNSGVTAVQQIVKNGIMGKPLFENVGRAVVENAGINLIGAFAGSLGPSRAGTTKWGLPTGGTPAGGVPGATLSNLGQAFTANSFNTASGVGLGSAGGMAMFGTATVGGGAAHGAAMPVDNNAVSTNQGDIASANSETRGRVGGGVASELANQQATHNTPAPSAPFTFDPNRH